MDGDIKNILFEHITLDSSAIISSASNQFEKKNLDPFLECEQRILKVKLYRLKEENEHVFEEKLEPTIEQIDPFHECQNRTLKVKLYRLKEENVQLFKDKVEPVIKQKPFVDDSTTPYLESLSQKLKNPPLKSESTDEKNNLKIFSQEESCFDQSQQLCSDATDQIDKCYRLNCTTFGESTTHLDNLSPKIENPSLKSESADEKTNLKIFGQKSNQCSDGLTLHLEYPRIKIENADSYDSSLQNLGLKPEPGLHDLKPWLQNPQIKNEVDENTDCKVLGLMEPYLNNSVTKTENTLMKRESFGDEKTSLKMQRPKVELCFDDSKHQFDNVQVKTEMVNIYENTGLAILGPMEPCFDDRATSTLGNTLVKSNIFEDQKANWKIQIPKIETQSQEEDYMEYSPSEENCYNSDWTDSISMDDSALPSYVPVLVGRGEPNENSLKSVRKTQPMVKSKNKKSHKCGKWKKHSTSLMLFKERAASKCGSTKLFTCKKCNRSFRSKYYFLIHKRLKCKTLQSVVCNKCTSRFSSYKSMVAHKNLKCSTSSSYICNICDKRFSKAYLFANHFSIIHKESKPLVFKTSTFRYKEKSAKRMETESRKQRRFSCSRCSKKFCQKNELSSHLYYSKHCGENWCKFCLKTFPFNSALKLHIDSAVCGSNGYSICNVCSKGFLNKEMFKVHAKTKCTKSRTFHCVKCVTDFSKKKCLQTHLKKMHSILDKQLYNITCSKCSTSFSSEAGRKLHEKNCRPKKAEITCSECGEQFSCRQRLENHVRLKCNTLNACNICHKKFSEKSYLLSHLKMKCNTVKPFVCKVCGYKSSFKQMLTQHESSKCGKIKLFLCNQCGKQYLSWEQLKVHEASKCGIIKPYQCQKCKKRFLKKPDLSTHNDRLCGTKKQFKCNDCQKEFAVLYSLRIHLASKCVIYPNNNKISI